MKIPKYAPIEGHANLVRDTFSMGVINTNKPALQAAKKLRDDALRRIASENTQAAEIKALRAEVSELKELVQQLIQNKAS